MPPAPRRRRGALYHLIIKKIERSRLWQKRRSLKGFTSAWYRQLGGDLKTVKRSIALAAERCHVEVTTLLVPGENDSAEEIRELAQWLASISPEIPLHLSRFFPRYQMTDRPPTPVEQVYRLAEAAQEYLSHVYTGNC